MIELYECSPVRSQRARWALEELEIEYTKNFIDLFAGQQHSAEYRAIHPLGLLPAIKTDSYTIFESVAIVMQLIDEHPEKKLAPVFGTPERASYYQWCVFACSELDPYLMMYFDNSMKPLEAMRPAGRQHNVELAKRGREDFEVRAEMLSKILSDRDYLVGSDFSGADILVGHSCFMATLMKLLDDYPVLKAYHERLKKRPAYQRAYTNKG